eukprot:CAMPEP_0202900682 /NCGR_PEP_ID=MMETSP1392-20130828/11982_1 /ASSEMBLY_ACC=CAM_ASM_000868 /TAXON_ID=225041 /ORGANISM="Chlamydomonas chlamydogama, Strain SAG 11-48b" /LENGTH=113 /DNA_ID=CAMNT_0049587123 /DNA_START=97 /DNA_END=440 /DNA_ORIENTATION=-
MHVDIAQSPCSNTHSSREGVRGALMEPIQAGPSLARAGQVQQQHAQEQAQTVQAVQAARRCIDDLHVHHFLILDMPVLLLLNPDLNFLAGLEVNPAVGLVGIHMIDDNHDCEG